MVHLVTRDAGRSHSFLNGTPIHPTEAAVIGCDCSTVAHLVAGSGEPLYLGRKTREWSAAQRRVIAVGDGGQCGFPGCQYRPVDIHHMHSWDNGGPTDVSNGISECRRHHRMLHARYRVAGDPNGERRFYRPGGSYLGSTYPAAGPRPRLAFGLGRYNIRGGDLLWVKRR